MDNARGVRVKEIFLLPAPLALELSSPYIYLLSICYSSSYFIFIFIFFSGFLNVKSLRRFRQRHLYTYHPPCLILSKDLLLLRDSMSLLSWEMILLFLQFNSVLTRSSIVILPLRDNTHPPSHIHLRYDCSSIFSAIHPNRPRPAQLTLPDAIPTTTSSRRKERPWMSDRLVRLPDKPPIPQHNHD